MTDRELLEAILTKMTNMENQMTSMKTEMQDIKSDLESQIKKTERRLSHKIDDAESAILDEVERVHEILDKHKEDKTKHTA